MAYAWRMLRNGQTEILGQGVPRLTGAALERFQRDVVARRGKLLAREARRTGVPLSLALAIVAAESWGEAGLTSPAGAVGLMQLMPLWWRGHTAEEMKDPALNAAIGMDLLAAIRKTQKATPVIASVYNCGSSSADNRPHINVTLPWGLCEDVTRDEKGNVKSSGYITKVVQGTNTAIDLGLGVPKSSGGGLALAALLLWWLGEAAA